MNTTQLKEELSDNLTYLLQDCISKKTLNQVLRVVDKTVHEYEKMVEIDSQFDDLFTIKKK